MFLKKLDRLCKIITESYTEDSRFSQDKLAQKLQMTKELWDLGDEIAFLENESTGWGGREQSETANPEQKRDDLLDTFESDKYGTLDYLKLAIWLQNTCGPLLNYPGNMDADPEKIKAEKDAYLETLASNNEDIKLGKALLNYWDNNEQLVFDDIEDTPKTDITQERSLSQMIEDAIIDEITEEFVVENWKDSLQKIQEYIIDNLQATKETVVDIINDMDYLKFVDMVQAALAELNLLK